MPKHTPIKIVLHKSSRELEIGFSEGSFRLGAEFLRVHSPSAEVQGHGPDQKKLPLDKHNVCILCIEAQGNYAIRLAFDDGHDSGIYTWRQLYDFAVNHDALWQQYLTDAEQEKRKRDGESIVKWV